MKTHTLKPGLLVSLKSTVKGGVAYRKIDLEAAHLDETGAEVARWETTREITDPAEFERATKARGLARSAITAVCCATSHGLLCPEADEDKLDAAIKDARAIADLFNAPATCSHVEVYVIVGRIAQNDVEAARAIGAEIRELLDAMRTGIAAADPSAIREAANKAKNLGAMLSADVAGQVSAAIIEAREAARAIVRRVEKAGETAAAVVADCSTARIDGARFAFLDLDDGAEVQQVAPAGRGIDYEPEPTDEQRQIATTAARRQIETDAPTPVKAAAPAQNYALEF